MTEVKLTDEQIKLRILRDEQKWAMAQKIAEVGEFSSASANRMLRALDPLEMQSRELLFGALSIAVTIAKKNKMGAPEMVSILHIMFQGIDAALADVVDEEGKKVEEEGEAPA